MLLNYNLLFGCVSLTFSPTKQTDSAINKCDCVPNFTTILQAAFSQECSPNSRHIFLYIGNFTGHSSNFYKIYFMSLSNYPNIAF